MTKLATVYEVLYYDGRNYGPAGDCSHIARFRSRAQAEAFVKGKTIWGKPATVEMVEVPRHLAQRWGVG